LSITDANLHLGRLIPELFPKIFGTNSDQSLDADIVTQRFEELSATIGKDPYLVSLGFVKVANETMCRPIKNLTQSRGFDPKDFILHCFGGAGGQHACAIAKNLNIRKIFVHKYSGILSALGISKAKKSKTEIFF